MNLIAEQRGAMIREEASRLGFDEVGFTPAEHLEKEALFLQDWLSAGNHAGMDYMARNLEKRNDPSKLVEGARSVVVLLKNYAQPRHQQLKSGFKLARYARGRDYHKVLKKRLKELMEFIRANVWNEAEGRFFVDSAPVSERSLAARAGLGWRGKNTNLLHPHLGSYVFIATIILNVDIPYGTSIMEACGACTRCIDACPTGALEKPYHLNANKCISYLTIENKGGIPSKFKEQFHNWIFGCDICQEVCPWNWKARPHREPDFDLRESFRDMSREHWLTLDEKTYETITAGSPLRRAKFSGLKRNLNLIG